MLEKREVSGFSRSVLPAEERFKKVVARGKKAVFAPFCVSSGAHGNNSKNIHSAVTTVLSNVAIIKL